MDKQIEQAIREAMTSNKIFTVVFIKKNGEERKMTARMGVKKGLKTNKPSTVAHIPKYLTVYELSKQQYRNVDVETIKKFKCGSVVL